MVFATSDGKVYFACPNWVILFLLAQEKYPKERHPMSGLSGTGFAHLCDQTPHPKGSLDSDRFFMVFAQPVLDTLRSKRYLEKVPSYSSFMTHDS